MKNKLLARSHKKLARSQKKLKKAFRQLGKAGKQADTPMWITALAAMAGAVATALADRDKRHQLADIAVDAKDKVADIAGDAKEKATGLLGSKRRKHDEEISAEADDERNGIAQDVEEEELPGAV
jgi:hypothetical protein